MFISASPILRLPEFFRKNTDFQRWLPNRRQYFLSNGRSALYQALAGLNVQSGNTVLLPAYLCSSVIMPFQAYGCNISFYQISVNLEPNLHEIEECILREGVSALLVIHYFGFPVRHFSKLLELCVRYNVKVIEDCAHALFSRMDDSFLGSFGAASTFSLRKSLPIPSGGLLTLQDSSRSEQDFRFDESRWKFSECLDLFRELFYALEHRLCFSLRTYLLSFDRLRNKAYEADSLTSENFNQSMGVISRRLLHSFNPKDVYETRRKNFRYLLSQLSRLRQIGTELYKRLPDGVCPNGFPILVQNRDEVRRLLYRKGIALRTFWDVLPKELPLNRFPASKMLRDRILILPVPQDVSKEELDIVLRELC